MFGGLFVAITKKRRIKNTLVNARVSTLKETIRNEVIGVFVVGMACLGIVALYSDRSGVFGGEIRRILTVLAGGGRVWIPIMVGVVEVFFHAHGKVGINNIREILHHKIVDQYPGLGRLKAFIHAGNVAAVDRKSVV